MTEDLRRRRQLAAEHSGGASDDVLYRRVLAELEAVGAAGSILDFGAGTGRLASALAAQNSFERVAAADLLDYGAPVAPGIEWIHCDLNERLPLEDETFDAVVAMEVIEHLENPRAVAREWFRLLRPGGIVVATTPNNESWRSLLSLVFRGHFIAFTDPSYPAHITALTRADLVRVLREAGFDQPRFFFSDHGSIPRVTSVTWQSVSLGRLTGLRYSDNLGCVARRP